MAWIRSTPFVVILGCVIAIIVSDEGTKLLHHINFELRSLIWRRGGRLGGYTCTNMYMVETDVLSSYINIKHIVVHLSAKSLATRKFLPNSQ